MKAITYGKYGPPDVLKMEDLPRPVPGDDDVLVNVHAVSINAWDWDMLTGKPLEYRFFGGFFRPKYNTIHGCDIAGRVAAVGKHVTRFKIGDAVFGDLAEKGWGAFAEYVCASEDVLIHKPEKMTFEDAACLPHGGNLAVQGLIDYGRIQAGQAVLIIGGGGSTGTLAIQIAKYFDVHVTAVDRTEKLDMMRALGADHVIDYTQDDVAENGRAFDLIFDVKTTRSIFDYRRMLKPGGAYVTVGGKTSRILQLLLLKRMPGMPIMHMVGYTANKDTNYLVELFEAGKLKPAIDKRFRFEETADAFRYYGTGRFQGKIVVTLPHAHAA